MHVKCPAYQMSQSGPSVNTESPPPAVPEKVGSGLLRQETLPEFLVPAGPSSHCPASPPHGGRGGVST